LKHTVILKPRWGTDAVYRALDDKELFERRGRMQVEDLARIWNEERYAGKHDELLRLMINFHLCYPVSDSREYIVPHLLPTNQPAYEWPASANLVFRYEYDFMPKGLITRLIVAMHHRIADRDMVWKSGAIFEREGARAEVLEEYQRRQIRVRANGQDARGLIAIVDNELERIHAAFPKLKLEKNVPCNCKACTVSPDPYLYKVSALKQFAAKGRQIQCYDSGEMVDASALLRELFPGLAPRDTLRDKPAARRVYVSYKHTDEGIALVDLIENVLRDHGICLLRDRNEVGYRESFRKFMKRLGAGDAIVLVLSKAYLESDNCVFELTEVAARGDLRGRIYPIVFPDAKIYDPESRLDYALYWDQRTADLREKFRRAQFPGAQEDLEDFGNYQRTIDSTLRTIADMSALTPKDGLQALVAALEKRLTS
jgi:hypothetical protein